MKNLLNLLGVLFASACLANVIRVPEDYTQIHLAVSAASEGDTVLISSGDFFINEVVELTKSVALIGTIDQTGDILTNITGSSRILVDNWNEFPNDYSITMENIKFSSSGVSFFAVDIGGCNEILINKCSFDNTRSPIRINSDNINVDRCYFRNNTGYLQIAGHFGLSNLTIRNTHFEQYNGLVGNCEFTIGNDYNDSLQIANCVFRTIAAYGFVHGGTIRLAGRGLVRNCIFYQCSTSSQDGNAIGISGQVAFKNNIFWNNSFNHTYGCLARTWDDANSSVALFDYNCLEYGASYLCDGDQDDHIGYGEGNISSNPNLDFSSFHLNPNSPCIDAGDPNSPLDPDGTRADIGAYYFCQGEGIRLPDIVRTSTEPGYPEPITATLQSTCDPVAIDSARTDTGMFTLDSYPSQVAGEFQSGDFQLTFHPSVQGVFTDTLHIWANTDPPHHKIPLVGESGPIPSPVTDLSISILPDLSAQLTWSPVTQTIYGNPVTPDYYLIFYNEQDPTDETDWYYLTPVAAPGYTHQLVARFCDLMNYRVIAWKGIDPALLGLTPGVDFPTFLQVSKDMRR